jgi:hypothetical protein
MSSIVLNRGIRCIDTFPNELVWGGIPGTVLECANCIYYASDPITHVLFGLCIHCASEYNGKYGCGYFIDLKGHTPNDIPVTFGGLSTENALDNLHIYINSDEYVNSEEYDGNNGNDGNIYFESQTCIKTEDVFSIYNLALLSDNDINLLKKQPNNGWITFKTYYNLYDCKDSDMQLILILKQISQLKSKYETEYNNILFNKEFYKECVIIENDIKKKLEYNYVIEENKKEFNNNNNSNSSNGNSNSNNNYKYQCNYCKILKQKSHLKKCSICKKAKYCSIACQTRDWKLKHKVLCSYSQINSIKEEEEDEEEDIEKDKTVDLEQQFLDQLHINLQYCDSRDF